MATAFLQVKNSAASALAASITDVATVVTVTAGDGAEFPAAFPFDLSVGSEIMRATSSAGADSFNVTRGAQGTTAAAHSAGAAITLRVTAQSLSDLNAAVNTLEDGAALLGGRAGGQTFQGGTGAGENLSFESSAHPTKGKINLLDTGRLLASDRTITSAANALEIENAYSLGAGGGFRALVIGAPITITSASALATLGLVFNFNPAIDFNAGAIVSGKSISVFRDEADLTVTQTQRVNTLVWDTVFSDVSFGAATTPASPHTLTRYAGVYQRGQVTDADWRFTDYFAVIKANPVGSATADIQRIGGLLVEDLTHAGITGGKHSVLSLGAGVTLQHAGAGVFGSSAAPSNASVGLEVLSTTKAFLPSRMTSTQRDALTPLAGMVIWNTTTTKLEVYDGTVWTAVH